MFVHLGVYPFTEEKYLKAEMFWDGRVKLKYRQIVPENKMNGNSSSSTRGRE